MLAATAESAPDGCRQVASSPAGREYSPPPPSRMPLSRDPRRLSAPCSPKAELWELEAPRQFESPLGAALIILIICPSLQRWHSRLVLWALCHGVALTHPGWQTTLHIRHLQQGLAVRDMFTHVCKLGARFRAGGVAGWSSGVIRGCVVTSRTLVRDSCACHSCPNSSLLRVSNSLMQTLPQAALCLVRQSRLNVYV